MCSSCLLVSPGRAALAGFVAVTAWPATSVGALTTQFEQTGHLGVHVTAFASSGVPADLDTLSIVGLPDGAETLLATLYGNNYFDAAVTPQATFGGIDLGLAAAFDEDELFSTYRWDVTSLVTGNGEVEASFSGFTNSFGLALVVVYSAPTLPLSRVVINDGAVDVVGGETVFTAFEASAGAGDLWIHTAADNNGGREQIRFNGELVGGPIDANLGAWASLLQLPVETIDGRNSASILDLGDRLGWDLAVLRTEPAAAVVPVPAAGWLLAWALLGAASTARRRRSRSP